MSCGRRACVHVRLTRGFDVYLMPDRIDPTETGGRVSPRSFGLAVLDGASGLNCRKLNASDRRRCVWMQMGKRMRRLMQNEQ